MLRFNLKALVRRARPATRRLFLLPAITPTDTLQAQLERTHQRVVRAWWVGCRDLVMPAYRFALEQAAAQARSPAVVMDDANQLGGTANSLAEQLDRLVLELQADFRTWAMTMERWHRSKWVAGLTPTGVNLGTLLGPEDVQQTLETTIQNNVSLVRSISSEARTRIEGIVFRGFTNRTPAAEIAREISEAVGMSRTRARGIAIDQTTKLSAQLDTERFLQAGLDEFEWLHSGKLHFRPWHRQRNGKRFKLHGEIAADDMPGVPPYCGCKKRAVLSLE